MTSCAILKALVKEKCHTMWGLKKEKFFSATSAYQLDEVYLSLIKCVLTSHILTLKPKFKGSLVHVILFKKVFHSASHLLGCLLSIRHLLCKSSLYLETILLADFQIFSNDAKSVQYQNWHLVMIEKMALRSTYNLKDSLCIGFAIGL